MKRNIRRIIRGGAWLLVMAVLFLPFLPAAGAESAASGSAEADAYGGRTPWIQDDADLLTAAEEEELYTDMLPLCEYGTPLFWTTNEAGDYYTQAERFYHSRLDERESGTLLVINMYARQLTIFSDGDIHRAVNRGDAETITDNIYRLAGRGEYYECASSAFSQILALTRGEKIARPMKLVSNILLALTLALMIMYLYLSRRYENRPKIGAGGAALPVSAAAAAAFAVRTADAHARMTQQHKTNISSSGSGRGGHGGGGFGGGGGGHSGGGGSHGF